MKAFKYFKKDYKNKMINDEIILYYSSSIFSVFFPIHLSNLNNVKSSYIPVLQFHDRKTLLIQRQPLQILMQRK